MWDSPRPGAGWPLATIPASGNGMLFTSPGQCNPRVRPSILMNSDRRPTPDRVKFISGRPRRLGIDFVALAATYRPVLFVFIGPGRPPRGVGFLAGRCRVTWLLPPSETHTNLQLLDLLFDNKTLLTRNFSFNAPVTKFHIYDVLILLMHVYFTHWNGDSRNLCKIYCSIIEGTY